MLLKEEWITKEHVCQYFVIGKISSKIDKRYE